MTGWLRRCGLRTTVVVLTAIASAGCAAVADLDDAELITIARASSEDIARYQRALELSAREGFGGASINDTRRGIRVSFTADQYDEYLAFMRDHPELDAVWSLRTPREWPVGRISFRSRRVLIDPRSASGPAVIFSLCDAVKDERQLYGFGMSNIMWNSKFVGRERALQIEQALQTDTQPQDYEVFFRYVYWDGMGKSVLRKDDPITLLPLPGDLCLALYVWNHPLPSSVGRPLRIDKVVVNEGLGPLPRQLTAPAKN